MSDPNWPNSYGEPFLITSAKTTHYNCIAWAFGDDTKWYWPDLFSYWPPNINRELNIQSFISLYNLNGYEVCDNGNLEEGIEKIAIFTNIFQKPTHASRQLENGNWTSKLGEHHDVEHSLNSMNGGFYGNATTFMSRLRII